jgi:hypothetical protein
VVPGDGEEVWGKYIWTRRVGKDRGSKETYRCPLILLWGSQRRRREGVIVIVVRVV